MMQSELLHQDCGEVSFRHNAAGATNKADVLSLQTAFSSHLALQDQSIRMPVVKAATFAAGMAASRRKDQSKIRTAEEAKKEFESLQSNDRGRSSIDTTASSRSPSRGETVSSSKSMGSQGTSTTDTTTVISPASEDRQSIRVYTKGSKLSSGFDYHPALFDLQIHPTKWEEFSTQVVESTKLSFGDNANAWATAILSFTVFPHPWHIGRNQTRRLQEKTVKTVLDDASTGALGDIMQTWNEGYFQDRGLAVNLELSEEAMRSSDQRSSLVSGEAHWHLKKEDRDRHRQERKFVIVVTRLGEKPQQEPGAVHELPVINDPLELANVKDTKYHTAEAPGEIPQERAELPEDTRRAELPGLNQYSELEANNEDLLKKETLMVTADTHALLHKELNSG